MRKVVNKGLSEVMQIENTVKMSDFSVINSDFTRARCRVMYAGRNRNHTDITENALSKLIERKGYANVPVVAHLYKDSNGKWRVGGHDSKLIVNANDEWEIIDETIPFGVVPTDCNPRFEEVTETTGAVKKYFCVDVILWTHRYNIMDAVKSDELWFNQSMEITINNCTYDKDDYCVIEDFNLSALCLLNHDPANRENEVEPCFPSASVSKFALDGKIKSEFDVMRGKLRELNMLEMEVNTNMNIDAIKSNLSTDFSVLSATQTNVYAIKKDSFEVYEIPYFEDKENGNITFDYDKAVKKYLAVSETDGGIETAIKDCVAEFGSAVENKVKTEMENKYNAAKAEIADEFIQKLETQTTENARLQAENDAYSKRIAEFEAAEDKAREDAHKAEIDSIVASFADKLKGSADYFVYKTKVDYSKSAEDVRKDLYIMLGMTVGKTDDTVAKFVRWDANTNVPKRGGSNSRYGDLMDNIDD